jgi:UDP-N-acetylglucosamine 2-epimerase (non-hydrolysing)
VLREVTERMEAVKAGCALLLGTDRDLIVATATRLLRDDATRQAMTGRGNPFGDGAAARRSAAAIAWLLGLVPERPGEFDPDLRVGRAALVSA